MKRQKSMRLTKKQVQAGILISPESAYSEISVSRLRSKLGEMLNRVQYGKECVMVTARGKRVAQILPVPEE